MDIKDNIEIKEATINDLQIVFDIVRKASDWMKEKYGFKHWDDYYTLEKIKENFEKKNVYLLYTDNIPVATYAVSDKQPYYYSKDNLSKFTNSSSKAYYPTTIAVLPKYHGNGYAKMLIKHLEELAKKDKINYIRFDARSDYKELITFYIKMGFKIAGELKDEDEIYYLFEKIL